MFHQKKQELNWNLAKSDMLQIKTKQFLQQLLNCLKCERKSYLIMQLFQG
jgi:hypothetical protein